MSYLNLTQKSLLVVLSPLALLVLIIPLLLTVLPFPPSAHMLYGGAVASMLWTIFTAIF